MCSSVLLLSMYLYFLSRESNLIDYCFYMLIRKKLKIASGFGGGHGPEIFITIFYSMDLICIISSLDNVAEKMFKEDFEKKDAVTYEAMIQGLVRVSPSSVVSTELV